MKVLISKTLKTHTEHQKGILLLQLVKKLIQVILYILWKNKNTLLRFFPLLLSYPIPCFIRKCTLVPLSPFFLSIRFPFRYFESESCDSMRRIYEFAWASRSALVTRFTNLRHKNKKRERNNRDSHKRRTRKFYNNAYSKIKS